jgi:uncharacterized protein YceK
MRAVIVLAFAILALLLGGCSAVLPSAPFQKSAQAVSTRNSHPTPGYCYAQGQEYDVDAQKCTPPPPAVAQLPPQAYPPAAYPTPPVPQQQLPPYTAQAHPRAYTAPLQ